MKYKQLIQKSAEDKLSEKQEYQVEDAQLQLEADLKVTQRELKAETRKLAKLKSAEVLSSADLVDCINKIDALKGGVKILNALEKELF